MNATLQDATPTPDRPSGVPATAVQYGDNLWADPETGVAYEVDESVGQTTFSKVDTDEEAEYQMQRLFDLDLEANTLRTRKQILVSNLDAMIADVVTRRNNRERWFGPLIAKFALKKLPRDKDGELKKKTWWSTYGSVAFTDKQPSVKMGDRNSIIVWAMAQATNIVKHIPAQVEVDGSLLTPVQKDAIEKGIRSYRELVAIYESELKQYELDASTFVSKHPDEVDPIGSLLNKAFILDEGGRTHKIDTKVK